MTPSNFHDLTFGYASTKWILQVLKPLKWMAELDDAKRWLVNIYGPMVGFEKVN